MINSNTVVPWSQCGEDWGDVQDACAANVLHLCHNISVWNFLTKYFLCIVQGTTIIASVKAKGRSLLNSTAEQRPNQTCTWTVSITQIAVTRTTPSIP